MPGAIQGVRRWLTKPVSALRWLSGDGYAYLTADDQRLASMQTAPRSRTWLSLMLLGVAWGIGSMWLWQGALDLFYDVRFRTRTESAAWLAVAAVLATQGLWLYRRSFVALGDALSGRRQPTPVLTQAILVAIWILTLLSLERPGSEDYPYYLPGAWQWLVPAPAWFRTLILAPVWGAWSMLVVCQFCRPCEATDPATSALARGCGPMTTVLCLSLPLAGSLLYFQYLGPAQTWIPAITIFGAIASGLWLCRRNGGIGRDVLLAVNLLTQLTFMLTCIAVR